LIFCSAEPNSLKCRSDPGISRSGYALPTFNKFGYSRELSQSLTHFDKIGSPDFFTSKSHSQPVEIESFENKSALRELDKSGLPIEPFTGHSRTTESCTTLPVSDSQTHTGGRGGETQLSSENEPGGGIYRVPMKIQGKTILAVVDTAAEANQEIAKAIQVEVVESGKINATTLADSVDTESATRTIPPYLQDLYDRSKSSLDHTQTQDL
ncbi:hypothetical protein ScPMuIL_002135, partial [Solemya velum]